MPWRFSDAGHCSAWIVPPSRRPKTCTEADHIRLPHQREQAGQPTPRGPWRLSTARHRPGPSSGYLRYGLRIGTGISVLDLGGHVMKSSSSFVAPSAVAILSTAVLCGLSGTAMSQTATGPAIKLPGVTVQAPRQVARPNRPKQVTTTVASRRTWPTTQTPSRAPNSVLAQLAKLEKTSSNCTDGCQTSFKSGNAPWIGCNVSGGVFHRRAETCATSKPMRSALKTDCCWATDPVNNGRIAPASPPGRSFRLPNSSHQDVRAVHKRPLAEW